MSEMAVVESGRQFWGGSSGKWAGEQLLKALKAKKPFNASCLRTLDTLRRDEWKIFDETLVRENEIRLRGVADLIAAGLTKQIPNSLGKTVLEYEKMSDLDPATVSLDGVTRGENDTVDFDTAGLPLPLTHKDWYLNLRKLIASRERGDALDTIQSERAGRKIAEMAEYMLFRGGKTFVGLPIYGYTTHPDRNQDSFGTNGSWSNTAKTGADILADIGSMLSLEEGDGFFGPFQIYIATGMSLKMTEDWKAASDKTILQRILEMPGISGVTVADQMPANTVVMVQFTSDVVQWVQGERLQTIQWDVHGGFQLNYKAFQIAVPLIKSDTNGKSGVVVMT